MNSKIKYLITCLSIFLLITSCSDDDTGLVNETDGSSLMLFDSSSYNTSVLDNAENIVLVKVNVSNLSEQDRNFNITTVDSLTTADSSMYSLVSSSFVIPANEYSGYVQFEVNEDNVPDSSLYTVVLKLSSDTDYVNPNSDLCEVSFRKCLAEGEVPLDYSVSVYAFSDEAPSHNQTLTLVQSGDPMVYSTQSCWGPMFVAWATANDAYANQFLYAGFISIYSNGDVVFQGDYGTGQGIRDNCTGVIDFTVDQNLFTTSFDVQCVFTPL